MNLVFLIQLPVTKIDTHATDGIDWSVVSSRLPTKLDKDSKRKRDKMFTAFDTEKNGFLSLAEIVFHMLSSRRFSRRPNWLLPHLV